MKPNPKNPKQNNRRKNMTSRHELSRWDTFGIGSEKNYLIENLALLLESGLDILSALSAIRRQAHAPQMRTVIIFLHNRIEEGIPLWQALEQTHLFPSYTIGLTRLGEESGRLPNNLRVIADQQQRQQAFGEKVRSAMTYPVLVLFLTLVIGLGVSWLILPKLAVVFESLNVPLPAVTKLLIAFGKFLALYGLYVVPLAFLVLTVFIYLLFFYKNTKFLGQGLLFYIGPFRRLIQEVELAHFGFTMGTLLETGLPIVTALEALQEVTSVRMYQRFYAFLKNHIEEGDSFAESFAGYRRTDRLIAPAIQQMIVSSEQSGKLAQSFIRIGTTYEEKAEVTTKNITVILEPVLLLVVWFGVVSLALAVILPIYGLIGGLNTAIEPQQQETTRVEQSPTVQLPIALLEPQTVLAAPVEDSVIATPAPIVPTLVPVPVVTEPPTTTATMVTVTLQSGYVNLRSEPTVESSIIGKVLPDQLLTVLSYQDGWYQVRSLDATTGWIIETYVQPSF